MCTVCIDFICVFAQADIPKGQDIYIHILQGCKKQLPKNICLCLNISLYGQVDAARLWCKKLKAILEAQGFT